MTFIPQLVKDKETGKLCMQIKLGGYMAVLPLPDDFHSWPEARKQNFYEMVTSEMKSNLLDMRRTDQRKLKRRASEGNS